MCHRRRIHSLAAPLPLPLVWHSWTRAANAACETINHEIENAADDDDDDLKSKSMQSRLLSQFRQAAESGLPPSTPTSLTLFPIPTLTHVLRPFVPLLWPGRRKEVPERARALPQSKCLPRIRAPKVQQEGRGKRRRHIEYSSFWARVQTLRSCARHKNPMTLH